MLKNVVPRLDSLRLFLDRIAPARKAYVLLLFKNIMVISARPILSQHLPDSLMKFAGLVELWP